MSITKDLISRLSIRFRNENDLSDLIWSLCEVSTAFQGLFVSFFFKELSDNKEYIELKREYCCGSSRADFYFAVKQNEYLIEVKLYDTNYHFDQYIIDFPNAKRGWIANYRMPQHASFEVKTWDNFHSYLEANLASISDKDNHEIISGFCEYLKSVCSIVKFQKMNLNGLQSLFFFNKMLPKIIEQERPGITIKLYGSAKSHFEDSSGKFFSIQPKDQADIYYPWFGIYYDSAKTCICIGFSVGWCRKIFEGIRSTNDLSAGTYHIGKYFDDNNYWFEMKPDVFDRFNNLDSPEDQEQILQAFFEEVIDSVRKYF